jgi:hypothetical protein
MFPNIGVGSTPTASTIFFSEIPSASEGYLLSFAPSPSSHLTLSLWRTSMSSAIRGSPPDSPHPIPLIPIWRGLVRCTPEVRQKVYPTHVIVNGEPLIRDSRQCHRARSSFSSRGLGFGEGDGV